MSPETKATLITTVIVIVTLTWTVTGILVPDGWTGVVFFGPPAFFLLLLIVLTVWQGFRDWFEKQENEK